MLHFELVRITPLRVDGKLIELWNWIAVVFCRAVLRLGILPWIFLLVVLIHSWCVVSAQSRLEMKKLEAAGKTVADAVRHFGSLSDCENRTRGSFHSHRWLFYKDKSLEQRQLKVSVLVFLLHSRNGQVTLFPNMQSIFQTALNSNRCCLSPGLRSGPRWAVTRW